jgi:hypothetical protein
VTFAQPRPIEERDVLTPFDCGVEDLNQWLVQRSLRAHRRGSARTYVVFGDDGLLPATSRSRLRVSAANAVRFTATCRTPRASGRSGTSTFTTLKVLLPEPLACCVANGRLADPSGAGEQSVDRLLQPTLDLVDLAGPPDDQLRRDRTTGREQPAYPLALRHRSHSTYG